MSNLWALRGIHKMLMDKRLKRPRLKNRSYQLKLRTWSRLLSAADNKIERLELENEEMTAAISSMVSMLKNKEWAEHLTTNDLLSQLEVEITNLHAYMPTFTMQSLAHPACTVTIEQLLQQIEQAKQNIEANDTEFPDDGFEDGIIATLEWILGGASAPLSSVNA